MLANITVDPGSALACGSLVRDDVFFENVTYA